MYTVFHILADGRPGGGARHVLSLVQGLDRGRYRCRVACAGNGPDLLSALRSEGVPTVIVEMIDWRRWVQAVVQLRRAIRAARPDLIHLHGTRSALYGGLSLLFRHCGCVVYTVHGFSFNRHPVGAWRERMLVGVERLLCRTAADRVVYLSEVEKEEGLRRGISDPWRSMVIHPGVHIHRADARSMRIREELLGDGRVLVGMVGRLVAQKGVKYFVEAAAHVYAELPDARFVVVGDGEARPECEALASALGVSDVIRFTGFRTDVPAILLGLDVVAIPSIGEGLPYVVLEAMVAGKAVVASGVDGLKEVVKNGYTGYLIPPKDSERLAEGILKVLRDPAQRVRMGQHGRSMVEAEYSLERMIHRTEALYEEMLAGGVGGAMERS